MVKIAKKKKFQNNSKIFKKSDKMGKIVKNGKQFLKIWKTWKMEKIVKIGRNRIKYFKIGNNLKNGKVKKILNIWENVNKLWGMGIKW